VRRVDKNELLNQLSDELRQLANEVDAALESEEDAVQLAAGDKVDAFVVRFREALASLSPADRSSVEMRLDRRVIDLRRAAGRLVRRAAGSKVELAKDAGQVPFILQRSPGRDMKLDRGVPRAKLSVGSDVDAWCGKCKELREHRIVAMVGDEPKQVVCNTCGSRHTFRSEPARRGSAATAAADGGSTTSSARAPSSSRTTTNDAKRDERAKLQRELAEAENPREFDPRGRYKAGEIIVHAEHGRGKIENVLRGSLLVRFSDGLKPLNLL
jgi:hypothetical protein